VCVCLCMCVCACVCVCVCMSVHVSVCSPTSWRHPGLHTPVCVCDGDDGDGE
jgi:hypothetical protein